MKIAQQPVVITGGGSGMGAVTAQYLAAQGAAVTVLDMNGAAAEKVAAQIGGLGLSCDVRDSAQVQKALHIARKKWGPVRVCINCAGIAPAQKVLGKEGAMPLEAFDQVIAINLIGSFNVMRLCAAEMSEASPMNEDGERGVIINTASVAAFDGQIGQTAYSASKGGIVSMTLPAARELARFGIRVMTIAPGIIATPMLLGMPQNVQDSLAASVPFPHRLGKPEEFAALALHIVENPLLNGEVIRLDGALRMAAK